MRNTTLTTAQVIPDAVCNLRSSCDEDSITLKWDPPNNCTEYGDIVRYQIRYKKKSQNNTYQTVYSYPPSVISSMQHVFTVSDDNYNVSSLQTSTSYLFQVRAEGRNDLIGDWSEEKCCKSAFLQSLKTSYDLFQHVVRYIFIAGPIMPDQVRHLCVRLNPNKPSVTLKWSTPKNCANSNIVVRYRVRYRKKGERGDTYVSVRPFSGSLQHQVVFTCGGTDKVSSLQPLAKYMFYIRAEGRHKMIGDWIREECSLGRYIFIIM